MGYSTIAGGLGDILSSGVIRDHHLIIVRDEDLGYSVKERRRVLGFCHRSLVSGGRFCVLAGSDLLSLMGAGTVKASLPMILKEERFLYNEILYTGATHILKSPETYLSVLVALLVYSRGHPDTFIPIHDGKTVSDLYVFRGNKYIPTGPVTPERFKRTNLWLYSENDNTLFSDLIRSYSRHGARVLIPESPEINENADVCRDRECTVYRYE